MPTDPLNPTPHGGEASLEQLLQRFAQACSTVTFCEDDWQGLYRLALDIHRSNLKTHHSIVRDYLIKRGYSLQRASWVSARYQHFSELVSLDGHEKTS